MIEHLTDVQKKKNNLLKKKKSKDEKEKKNKHWIREVSLEKKERE